jgi:hypothetical protein
LLSLELWALRLAAIAAIIFGIWYAGDQHGHKVEQVAQAAALEAAREQVRIVEKAQVVKSQEADRVQQTKTVALQRALDAARSDVQRLRDATTGAGSLPGAAANPGLAAYAADGDRLLAECADEYRQVDGAKASLASRLDGLQRLVAPAPDQPASVSTP